MADFATCEHEYFEIHGPDSDGHRHWAAYAVCEDCGGQAEVEVEEDPDGASLVPVEDSWMPA